MIHFSHRWSSLTLAGGLALAPCSVVAQGGEADLLAHARTQIGLGNLDSAVALLGQVTGWALTRDSARRAEAFVLLAIVRYY